MYIPRTRPVEEIVESKLMWESIRKYLHKLTPKECEVMISLYVEQLSVSDTAAKLGVEKNTVSTHRRNACEKIRKEMEGNCMKIVVLDGYTENPGDLSWSALEQLGELVVYDRTSYEESDLVAERIGDADVAILNKTPISKATMDQCPNLKLIAVLATGYNVVDIAYAKEKGIPVCNVPNYGGYSVSQFAIALMLEACLHIGHHDRTVHEGKWQNSEEWCYWDYPLIEVAGKTYGLLGCGRIGIHTAEAAKALGMHVIAYDRYPSPAAKDLGVEFVELDDLFARSDVLGLQMPLMDFNAGIINKENIAKMKDGVIIINNSRGQMVVEQDLADALNSGKVACAGLDVVSTEPIRADNPLLKAKNCIITPHMSWGSRSSRQRIMDCTVENLSLIHI